MAGCWSQFPSDILELILQKLLLADCCSFGEVCKPWLSAFLDWRHLRRPPPFLIVKPVRGSPRCLGLHANRLPQLRFFRSTFHKQESILGSSWGWLVIASFRKYLHLLNLTSHTKVHLPSMGSRMSSVQYVALSSAPTSDDCIFVAEGWVKGRRRALAWYRPGDQSWSIITPPKSVEYIEQTMFYKGNLYVYEHKGDALIYSFNPHPNIRGRVSINSIGMNFNWFDTSLIRTLVESNEGLLLVMSGVIEPSQAIGIYELAEEREKRWERLTVIYKLAEERENRWERVESLGEQVLLLGDYGGESICTLGLTGSSFESNCVYQCSCIRLVVEKYCMADGSIEEISLPINYDGDDRDSCSPEVEWITPQSW